MSFVEVCRLADIPVPGALAVEVDDVSVAVVRTGDGGVWAIEDLCSHAHIALSEGEVEGCTVECWLHGSRFDLSTGEPLSPPASEPVPVYAVRVDGGSDDATVSVDIQTTATEGSTVNKGNAA